MALKYKRNELSHYKGNSREDYANLDGGHLAGSLFGNNLSSGNVYDKNLVKAVEYISGQEITPELIENSNIANLVAKEGRENAIVNIVKLVKNAKPILNKVGIKINYSDILRLEYSSDQFRHFVFILNNGEKEIICMDIIRKEEAFKLVQDKIKDANKIMKIKSNIVLNKVNHKISKIA